jgi:CCR4-NOT transcription complex subunit 1
MFSFASPLASQIGFLIASLNKSNYKSLALELNQLADYGLDGSVLLLRNCLQQFDLLDGSELQQHKWPLKLDLLSLVVKKLLRQPNAGSVFCEAVQHIPSSVVTKAFLENLSTELKLSLPEQIQLGLALTDAEELSHCQAGHSFCKAKISEIYQTLTPAGLSEVLIEKILWFLRQTEGLSRHEQTFVKALPSLEPDALSSLLLTPLILHDQVHEVNCLRSFKQVATSGILTSDMLSQLSGATSVVAVMEELGYSCTVNVEHCKEIFSMFPSLSEFDVAQIVGMVARTYKGLEDLQGTHDTFCTAFCNNGEQLSGVWSTTWNVDVLVDAISELVRYSNCQISVLVLYVNKAVVFQFFSPPSLMHPPDMLAGSRYQLEVSHGES